MKKVLVFLFLLLFGTAQSAQIVNVEYIHQIINQKWDIDIPYNPALTNPRVAANMKYLLTSVDVANEMLNGEKTTDYGAGEYATTVAADTVATNTAVDELVKKSGKYVFQLEHYYEKEGWRGLIRNPEHLLMISAAGTFYIDWGDGIEEIITKDTVGEQWFGHDYETDGVYSVRIGGRATMYSQEEDLSTVILSGDPDCLAFPDVGGDCPFILESISGCLGCVFSTLSDGSQPRFINTFDSGYFINSIPENLFAGISGAPVKNMFNGTFLACGALTSIPPRLFAGVSGPPAESMFYGTFAWCESLTGSIPENLFGDISGDAASYMFAQMFSGCSGLTGPSARINGKYLYEIWPNATADEVWGMYGGASGLADYENIPDAWK